MNLIEQLGGYEKAKAIAAVKDSHYMGCELKPCPELDIALLQYRREHGIYEVGDWIIPIEQPNDSYFHAYQIDRVGLYGGIYDAKWRLLSTSKFRHATDAEIEASKALNQCEESTC